jgi:hypothetical protein
MNTPLDRKTQSVGGSDSSSAETLAGSEKRPLAILRFFTLSGLLYVTAAVLTMTIAFGVLRDIFLAITITLFVSMLVGITSFILSYQPRDATRRTDSR